MARTKITDKQCLRAHHERLGRILDTRPWASREAGTAQTRMLASAAAYRECAQALDPQTAYGPALHIRDDSARRARRLSEAIAARDIICERDRLLRIARDIEMHASSIPQDRHDEAYVRWMLDHIATVEAYGYLCTHPDDHEGMTSAAQKVLDIDVGVEEVRIAARDCLDRWASLAGVPQWRSTYSYAGTL